MSAKPSWIKLLYPDHTRADAERAKANNLNVIVRAPGEGEVHYEDVQAIIRQFAGVCDVIEVGNEPPYSEADSNPLSLWIHAYYLEDVLNHCFWGARDHGITLCTPGWRNEMMFPPASVYNDALRARLLAVYSAYDAIGLHVYDPFRLKFSNEQLAILHHANPIWVDPMARVNAWVDTFSDRERDFHITEAGIAARLLGGQTDKAKSDLIKADHYFDLLAALALTVPRVRSVCWFLFGGTDGFARFNEPGIYDPTGSSSYWLVPEAWAFLGSRVAS